MIKAAPRFFPNSNCALIDASARPETFLRYSKYTEFDDDRCHIRIGADVHITSFSILRDYLLDVLDGALRQRVSLRSLLRLLVGPDIAFCLELPRVLVNLAEIAWL